MRWLLLAGHTSFSYNKFQKKMPAMAEITTTKRKKERKETQLQVWHYSRQVTHIYVHIDHVYFDTYYMDIEMFDLYAIATRNCLETITSKVYAFAHRRMASRKRRAVETNHYLISHSNESRFLTWLTFHLSAVGATTLSPCHPHHICFICASISSSCHWF